MAKRLTVIKYYFIYITINLEVIYNNQKSLLRRHHQTSVHYCCHWICTYFVPTNCVLLGLTVFFTIKFLTTIPTHKKQGSNSSSIKFGQWLITWISRLILNVEVFTSMLICLQTVCRYHYSFVNTICEYLLGSKNLLIVFANVF